jgi:ATP-dependent exoDNAse (exonuclease V) beta subunit
MTDFTRSLVVTAGAGSGKTTVLVERYLQAIDPTRPGGPLATPESIVALTFTTKAAREMLDRVRRELARRAGETTGERFRQAWQELFVRATGAKIQTMHSFAGELVREHPLETGVDPDAAVLEEFAAAELLEGAARRAVLGLLEAAPAVRALVAGRGLARLVDELVSIYRAIRASGEEFAAAEAATLANLRGEAPEEIARGFFRLLRALDAAYAAAKAPAALDFEDLQILARNLLRDHPGVRERLRRRFRYVMVDEFQDADPLQDQIVRLLAGEPPGDRLFLVGDPKQSIYRFRQAEVGLFTAWQGRMRAGEGGLIHLAENFRSQAGLVEFVNEIFARLMRPGPTGPDDAPVGYEPLKAARRAAPPTAPVVEVLLAERSPGENTETATWREARLLARRIKAMVETGEPLVSERPSGGEGPERLRPVRYGDVAILLRSRTRQKLFEAALAEAGVEYYVLGGGGFYQKPEVRDLISFLRAVDDPADQLSLAAALRSPLFGLPDDQLLLLAREPGGLAGGLAAAPASPAWRQAKAAGEVLAKARKLRSRLTVSRLLDLVLAETGGEATLLTRPGGEQRLANVRKLRQVAAGAEAGPCLGLTDFLAYFDRLADRSREEEAQLETEAGDAIKLLTVHAAKGLEFPVVVVADLTRRFTRETPVWYYDRRSGLGFCLPGEENAPTPLHARLAGEANERERAELVRLFYVAATRARDHLLLTGSAALEAAESKTKQPATCWLTWLWAALTAAGLPEGLVRIVRDAGEGPAGAPAGERLADRWPEPPPAPGGSPPEDPDLLLPLLASPRCPGRTVAVTTVSELMCYAACPRRYHLQYRLGLPPVGSGGSSAAGRLSPFARGSVVHRAIGLLRRPAERGGAGGQALSAALAAALAEAGVSPEDQAEVAGELRPLLQAYLAGEDFAALSRGEAVEFEAPFFFRLAPGVLVRGAVDLIRRSPQGLRLVDFKTNRLSPAEARRAAATYYRLQLPLYAAALQTVRGETVALAEYVFLGAGIRVAADVSEAALTAAREEARRLVQESEAGGRSPAVSASTGSNPSPCLHCGYVPLCDAGRRWLAQNAGEKPYEEAVS